MSVLKRFVSTDSYWWEVIFFLDEDLKKKYFATKHKTYFILLFIVEVDENEIKIKKEVYLISMVAVHNCIETLTHISH